MLKQLKSLFVVEDENSPKKSPKKETPKQTKQNKTTSNQKVSPSPTPSANVSPGKITTKFTEVLLSAMEKNNLDGFDYLEFKKSLQSLKDMPMDEATRFKSAFAMAQSMGVTTQKLVDSATFYLNVLEKEEQKFESALQNQMNDRIGNKRQKLQQLEQLIESKAEQIKKLTQEIEAHQKELGAIKQEITTSTTKVETTKNNFIASYENLTRQISNDINQIKTYLNS